MSLGEQCISRSRLTNMEAMTYVDIMGLRILEPVTTATDLIVSAVCFYAFFRLLKKDRSELYFKYFNWFFLTMGLATAIGGLIGHGFLYAFSFEWKLPGWLTSMLSISLLERASIGYAKPLLKPKLRVFLDRANIIELLLFMTLTFSTLNFFFVEVHSAFGLLVVNTPLHLYVYWKTRSAGSKYMLVAISFAMFSAIFFMNEISVHKWFNYFDISHLLMAMGCWFFYQTAKKLRLRKSAYSYSY
ncbi:MAG TPA: hypothetical protein VE870_04175 [Bacteroidales bacterium]|nr:hypothetical protein [Bacteroidales bacterium]